MQPNPDMFRKPVRIKTWLTAAALKTSGEQVIQTF
jgi:hypothetical protein